MQTRAFLGGMPYAPDVRRLNDRFPVPELREGRLIPHAELEDCLSYERGTRRYYAVVNAWLTQQRNDNGLILTWEHANGVRVLNPAEVLNHAEKRTRQKIRQTGKAIKTFAWVDRARLDETGKARLDHQVRVATVIKEAIEKGRKELAVDLAPVRSLPKRIA